MTAPTTKRFKTFRRYGTAGKSWDEVVKDNIAAVAITCAAIEDAVNTDWLQDVDDDEQIEISLTAGEAKAILGAGDLGECQ